MARSRLLAGEVGRARSVEAAAAWRTALERQEDGSRHAPCSVPVVRGLPLLIQLAALTVAQGVRAQSAPAVAAWTGYPPQSAVPPTPVVAQAQRDARHDGRWLRRVNVLGAIGLGMPVGDLGLITEFVASEYVVVGAGVGSSTYGAQYEGHARLRAPLGAVAPGLEIGGSTGPYREEGWFAPHDSPKRAPLYQAAWFNAELTLEGVSHGGFAWRTFIGLAEEEIGDTQVRVVIVGCAFGVALLPPTAVP